MKHTKDTVPDTIPIKISPYGQRIMDLKEEGHRIIDAIEFYGVATDDIYKRLAKLLNIPAARAHFSEMHNEQHINRAILALRYIQDDCHHKLVVVPRMKEIAKANKARQLAINAANKPAPPKSKKLPKTDSSLRMNVGKKGEIADRASITRGFEELNRRRTLREARRKRHPIVAWLFPRFF